MGMISNAVHKKMIPIFLFSHKFYVSFVITFCQGLFFTTKCTKKHEDFIKRKKADSFSVELELLYLVADQVIQPIGMSM